MQALIANYLLERCDLIFIAPQQTVGPRGFACSRMLDDMEPLDEDAGLMLRYREGDADAFLLLYTRHKGPLHRYLLRQVRDAGAAADLFQEVWSRLIATRARYEARAKFATYLFHIAHNCTMDFFRRDQRVQTAARAADAAAAPGEPQVPEHQRPDGIAEFAEQQSALLAALGRLPHEQREAFLLHEETGLTIGEIARVMDVGIETAKSRLRYAIRKLKKSLDPADSPRKHPLHARPLHGTRLNAST